MAYVLTEKLRGLAPYQQIEGEYPIRLDANESFLQLDGERRERVLEALARVPLNRYPDPDCTRVCKAFAAYHGIPGGLVTAGAGSDDLISTILRSFFAKGETVAVVEPDFSMYRFYLHINELREAVFRQNPDFSVSGRELAAFCREHGASGVILSNPCNPTSRGLSVRDAQELVTSFPGLVMLDEAYMDFWDQSLMDRVEEWDNLVILRTCSKAVGLAGARLGFAVAGPTVTNALRAVKPTFGVTALTQAAAAVVLEDREYLDGCRDLLVASREELYQGLSALMERASGIVRVFRPATNFVFLEAEDGEALFQGLLKRGIAVRPMGRYLRITAGSREENAAVLSALSDLLKPPA